MLSIIHPSRNRPTEAIKAINNWLDKAHCRGCIEYILSLDIDDPSVINYKPDPKVKIVQNNNRSAIDAINNAAKICTGSIIIVVSDDFDCPIHWDAKLKYHLTGKSDFLVKTQDGIQKTLITLPIMDRAYFNRFGYIYHPDYRHMYSDQEMTAVGHLLGRVITLPLLFPHNHYSVGKWEKDETNRRNDLTWTQGATLFKERQSINFGVEDPKINYNQIVWH